MNTQPKLLLRLGLMLFIAFSPRLLQAAIIYVDLSAAGANNGTTWANAYTSLSSALLASTNGDEIWVKQGVYKPTTLVDVNASGGTEAREATFQVPNGVAIYGGFAGTELARNERNWQSNPTILSGDIDNNDTNTDGDFIADNTSDIIGNNAYHVIYTINVNANTRVDGFIITAGKAQSGGPVTDANLDGGAWYNQLNGGINASSPTMANLVFQGNYAESEGGAIFNVNGTTGAAVLSLIENCHFLSNKSNFAGGAVVLGSFSAGNYQPHFINCEFSMNEAFRRGGAMYFIGDHAIIDSSVFNFNIVTAISPMGTTLPGSGGGVTMTASNTSFNYCLFTGNSATGNPTGAFEGGGGGAVYMSSNEPQTTTLGTSQPSFINCGFYSNIASGNTAAWGGAATHLSDGGKLKPRYVNCVFADNEAQNDGGAIANFTRVLGVADGYVPELSPAFTNCTFTGNHSVRGGAISNDGFLFMGSEVLQEKIDNCILWNNTASGSGNEIFNSGGNIVISYSLIKGSGGSGGGWVAATGTDGGHNIDANPSFVGEADPDGADNIPATDDDGLRLNPASPAADAGNNAAPGLAGITVDFRLGSRILGSKVDMGAYERAGIVIPHLPLYWLKDWRPWNPPCLVCPWAVLLTDKVFPQFIWDGPAQLIEEERNTAVIKGHIVNARNRSIGFDVFIKLVNQQDWAAWNAKGRTYTATTPEAILAAKRTHKTWTFWELGAGSYLKGTGELSGQIDLSKYPENNKTGFQLGTGANGWDKDLGLGGTFAYKGTIVQRGRKINFSGIGSINVDAELCKLQCTPLLTTAPRAALQQEELFAEAGNENLTIYPVPAHKQLSLSPGKLSAGMYTLIFYNNTGQLKKQQAVYLNKGNSNIAIDKLEPGMYILQLISSSGETTSKKLIIE